MPKFVRSFAVDDLAKWDAKAADNAVRALFDCWCLPGEASAGNRRLRLGLRNGYLNFYIKGQSVAKLSWGRSGPKLSVHSAYVSRVRKERGNGVTHQVQEYRDFDAAELADPATASLLAGWVETAETYASAEKRFVDDLVAANHGVLDLEMALPASNLPGSKRVAPRMDLVLAQRIPGERPSIVFWEAKCANNTELRTNAPIPSVVEQVEKYVRWITESSRRAEVQAAYQTTAQALLALHRHFRGEESKLPSVKLWRELGQGEAPAVTARPGVVIGNYWPEGYTEQVASGRMAQCARSFAKNGHRDKLQSRGIVVHEVGPDHAGPTLPLLSNEANRG